MPEPRGDAHHAGVVAGQRHASVGRARVDRRAGCRPGPRRRDRPRRCPRPLLRTRRSPEPLSAIHRTRPPPGASSRRSTTAASATRYSGVGQQRAIALDLADQPRGAERRGERRARPGGEAAGPSRRQAPAPQPHGLEQRRTGDHRQGDVAREAVRVLAGEVGAAGRRRASHRCARRPGSARRPAPPPARSASRKPASSRSGSGHAGRPRPSRPSRRSVPRQSWAGVPRRALDRPLERVADHRRRGEGERDQHQPVGAQSRRTASATSSRRVISSAAAVPACSATSKDLRSSGSSSL